MWFGDLAQVRHAVGTGASLAACLAASACAHREPPTPEGSPSVALPDVPSASSAAFAASIASAASAASAASIAPPASATAVVQAAAAPPAAPSAAPSAVPSASPSVATSVADPSTLPQTHDMPAASGPAFATRTRALWDAIVEDDPAAAMPFFFPLGAYEQLKDVGNPASDWKHRLVAAYHHDIHALHARLGADASHAKLVSLDVPETRARWVNPGEEYNKLGYYRVFGSKLRYDVGGSARSFDVKSLISWRGEWYVVHLNAVK
jgi:hypothetical protein